ncbi:glycoside hydrolase family 3 N-terminal domain-containing protein [Promicromonospora thailandica]|uniref:Beta-N-acetylhexosaminidase n=1 Tax=Promicromonospora thailandica TaxID=765201 RepID=A0A9X2G5R5_9MICO|nr:glycoside hydrolase family 3 N-terminal domain-containing protein [Promicromonospora thailandica]MCP2267314.1 beta-N-acetylhexosaminidase [Promicromonospora thailandica]BFF20828.1 glycoside hydrolase family 3 N-terminal domain-containing protein [Promicromonospora thailandica]
MSDERTVRAVNGVLLPGFEASGTDVPAWLADAARAGLAGVVCFARNTPDVETAALLSAALHAVSPDLLVAVDEEGGDVSRLEAADGSSLPGAAALGAHPGGPAVSLDAGRALGRLLAATGIDLVLSPVLDVVSEPDNPVVGVRAFGTTPDVVARHGIAFARGVRSAGVGVCGKHFPGHGATTVDSHVGLPVVDAPLDVVRTRDLAPFAQALRPEEGPRDQSRLDAVMTAHVLYPAIGPAPASVEPAATRLLRELGHDGPIITDALDMGALRRLTGTVGEAAVRAVEAGADLLCLGLDPALYTEAYDALAAAVAAGRVSVDRLEESAARTRTLVADIRDRRAAAGARTGPDAAQEALAELADLGGRIADAVVHVRGAAPLVPLPPDAVPDVADLRTRLDHAAGRTARHVQTALAAAWPGARVYPDDVPGQDASGPVPAELGLDETGLAVLIARFTRYGVSADLDKSSPERGAEFPGRLSKSAPRREPLVVITREPVPGSAERARLEQLWAVRPDLVVVHTGLPGPVGDWFGALRDGGPAVVVACGTGRANASAAVARLRGDRPPGR